MNKIKAIGFDWGGVIFQRPGPSFVVRLSNALGVEPKAFKVAYFRHNHMINKGPDTKDFPDMKEMWSAVLEDLGKLEQIDAFMEHVNLLPEGKIDLRMLALIKKLRETYKVGLFSNRSIPGAKIIREMGVEPYFDAFLISSEVGFMKPEPGAFQELVNVLGIQMDELVFVDDSSKALSTSGSLGYTPIKFTTTDALLKDLNEMGILSEIDF